MSSNWCLWSTIYSMIWSIFWPACAEESYHVRLNYFKEGLFDGFIRRLRVSCLSYPLLCFCIFKVRSLSVKFLLDDYLLIALVSDFVFSIFLDSVSSRELVFRIIPFSSFCFSLLYWTSCFFYCGTSFLWKSSFFRSKFLRLSIDHSSLSRWTGTWMFSIILALVDWGSFLLAARTSASLKFSGTFYLSFLTPRLKYGNLYSSYFLLPNWSLSSAVINWRVVSTTSFSFYFYIVSSKFDTGLIVLSLNLFKDDDSFLGLIGSSVINLFPKVRWEA